MRKFWVNALGEFGRDVDGNMKLLGGSVDIETLEETAGKRWTEMTEKEKSAVSYKFCIEDAAKKLTPAEYDILVRHYELSELSNGLFRFNGGILNGEPYLNLSFEFYLYLDEKAEYVRKRVDDFLNLWLKWEKKLTFTKYNMDEGKEDDHSWTCHPETGEKVEGSDAYGPNHGRPYQQFSIDVDVLTKKMKKSDVAPLLKEIRAEMVKRDILDLTVSVA